MHDFMHDGNGHWHACPVCAAENSVREAWLVTLTPAYVRDLLSIPCAETQLLSLIDVRTDLQQKYMGFHEGELFRASLFDAPLVHLSDSMHVSPPSWLAAMVRVLVHNLLHNPLYHTYKAMCELTGAASVYPVLPYEAVGNVLRQVQHRGHLYSVAQAHHLQASNIGLAVDADPRPPASRHTPYVVANLHRRHDNGVEQLLVASDGLGYMGNDNAVTAEAALFPFLFPLARGMYRGVARLTAYVKYRMSCLFTAFTLFKSYPLLMYAMRTADVLASQLSTVVLERDIYKYRQRYPNAELDEIMRHVLKYTLPSTLPGTPRWHQQHLQDLLKMVDAWGMPHLFLTLTSDEMSSTRWPEIDTLEALLRRVHPDASFRDAPVECAQLFHARLWAFLTRHIILP